MVRRGWSAIPAPAGWYEIIRGPTSVGAVAEEGEGKREPGRCGSSTHRGGAGIPGPGARVPGGRWNRGDSQRSAKIRSLAGALAALGPEDSSAKTEFEGALKRAKAQEGATTRIDPDARVGAAPERVARLLEQAIAAMGNCGHVDHFIEEGSEGCSGDAFGSTDQRSFHRTFQEKDRTIRRRTCSRSPEAGGESEKTGGAPGRFLFSQWLHSLSMPVQK